MPRKAKTSQDATEHLPTYIVMKVGPGPRGYAVIHRPSGERVGDVLMPPVQAREFALTLNRREAREKRLDG